MARNFWVDDIILVGLHPDESLATWVNYGLQTKKLNLTYEENSTGSVAQILGWCIDNNRNLRRVGEEFLREGLVNQRWCGGPIWSKGSPMGICEIKSMLRNHVLKVYHGFVYNILFIVDPQGIAQIDVIFHLRHEGKMEPESEIP